MSQGPTPIYALPTEPLLEIRTRGLARCQPKPMVQRWLLDLEAHGELMERARTLATHLRKRMGTGQVPAMLEGLLSSAAQGESPGVAALAALVAVRAHGHAVIEGVHEFRHLHRLATRYQFRLSRRQPLRPEEQKLLDDLAAIQPELRPLIQEEVDAFALPSPVDLGPAGLPRKVFELLSKELDSSGELGEDSLDVFLRLARLEQRAAEQRASGVAETLNPFAHKAVSEMLPRLAQLDTDIRDVASFLSAMELERDSRLFHEQASILHDTLPPDEIAMLLAACEGSPELASAIHIIDGVQHRPLSVRIMAYYVDRLLEIGQALYAKGLRPVPIDPLEAVILTLAFAGDTALRVPTGPAVVEALEKSELSGIELGDGELTVVFDAAAARRVNAPLGLPLPVSPEEEDGDKDSVRELVMANINNTSVLLGLLKNAKVYTTPGVVAQVASTCRVMRVLEVICTTKALHTGFANKDVPMHLVRSPVRIPVKTLRRLIHVKYISKVELRRMARDKTGLRREVFDEVHDYLSSLS